MVLLAQPATYIRIVTVLLQAEEEYNEAKSVYTKLHAELYEELPALFDRYGIMTVDVIS